MNQSEEFEQPAVPRRHPLLGFLLWCLQMTAIALIVVAMNLYVCRLVRVSGDSMYPTLHHNDILLVRILAYEPKCNNIVVCKTDEDGLMGGRYIVKRCIATAGQTVLVDYQANVIFVDGIALNEDYINLEEADPLADGGRENAFYLVPEGAIFVLGDNRNHSADSRDSSIGMVPLEDVMGGSLVHIPLGLWQEKYTNQ